MKQDIITNDDISDKVGLLYISIYKASIVYREYKAKGNKATLNDYNTLADKIESFYQVEPSFGESKTVKINELLESNDKKYKKAGRILKRFLDKNNFKVDEMIDEYNGIGKTMKEYLAFWKKEILNLAQKFRLTKLEMSALEKGITKFSTKISCIPMEEVTLEMFPYANKFIQDVLHEHNSSEKEDESIEEPENE